MKADRAAKPSEFVLRGAFLLGAAACFTFLLPLFHIVPLKEAREQALAEAFDAGEFVDKFWNETLMTSVDQALKVEVLLAGLAKEPDVTAERFGHRLGLGNKVAYWIIGNGTISQVEKRSVEIALAGGGTVEIPTGPLFGNAIRDGCGLLDVSDFANSQDFNAVSSEINRRVEEQVFPTLREGAKAGSALNFVGGVELLDSDGAPEKLRVVPVIVEFP